MPRRSFPSPDEPPPEVAYPDYQQVEHVGYVTWQDETEPRKRPRRVKPKPFPFGFQASQPKKRGRR